MTDESSVTKPKRKRTNKSAVAVETATELETKVFVTDIGDMPMERAKELIQEAHATLDEMETPKPSNYERKVAEMASLGKDADEYLDDRQRQVRMQGSSVVMWTGSLIVWPFMVIWNAISGLFKRT